jgi:hypothetical protein
MYVAKLGGEYYRVQKAKIPTVDQFLEIPHTLYWAGNLVMEYMSIFGISVVAGLLVLEWLKHNWISEERDIFDLYFPPFILHKYLTGLSIFSGLTLLISHIKYETIEAIETLEPAANKYEAHHLGLMLDNLGEGEKGTRQLDTGLLTKKLQLTLRIAGEGESASIRTALEIINKQGKESLLSALRNISTLILALIIFVAFLIVLQVGAASAFLMQESMQT